MPSRFLSFPFVLCSILHSHAFLSSVSDPVQISKNIGTDTRSVVLFTSKACRSCAVIKPKFAQFALQNSTSTPYYILDIGGNEPALRFAQKCGIHAIPCAVVIEQARDNEVHICTPKTFASVTALLKQGEEAVM